MARTRIIETDAGLYMPQFKMGWLSRWRFFLPSAVHYNLVSMMETFDPERAVKFATTEEAKAFILRVETNTSRLADEDLASRMRSYDGVRVRRIVS